MSLNIFLASFETRGKPIVGKYDANILGVLKATAASSQWNLPVPGLTGDEEVQVTCRPDAALGV